MTGAKKIDLKFRIEGLEALTEAFKQANLAMQRLDVAFSNLKLVSEPNEKTR